jgi:LysM repeat protein
VFDEQVFEQHARQQRHFRGRIREADMTIHAVKTPAARAKRIVLVLGVLAAALIVGPQAFADGPEAPVVTDTYTVASGETLWSIAAALTPAGDDVDATVAVIRDLNKLDGSQIVAGSQILIPLAG